MVSVNHRSLEILKILLQAVTPLSTAAIAARLDLTPRMVQYSLREVEQWLREKNIPLIKKTNLGISVDISDEIRAAMLRQLELPANGAVILSRDERMQIILLTLFVEAEPVLIKNLLNRLEVSTPTVLKDMDRVEEWLVQKGLTLVRRQHFGFKISGPEIQWREAEAGFLLDTLGTMSLLALCNGSFEEFNRQNRRQTLPWSELCPNLLDREWAFSRQLVDRISLDLQREFTDDSYFGLVLQLAILIHHVRQDRSVDLDEGSLANMYNRPEMIVVRSAFKKIEERLGRPLPESELAFFTLQLLGAKIGVTVQDMEGDRWIAANQPEVMEVVDSILTEACIYLHPSLKVDQYLIRGLALHFSTVLNRLRYGFAIRNPLLNEVKKQYHYIHEIARRSVIPLETRLGCAIPEEEIGYITMYLGAAMERLSPFTKSKTKVWVVCGEGVATAWLLVSKIKSEFPEIEVVEVMSAIESSRKTASRLDVDLIISTVPMESQYVPLVHVSPLLTTRDQQRLRSFLLSGQVDGEGTTLRKPSGGFTLQDLLTPETIQLGVVAQHWQEVVDKAGALLVETKAVEPRYLEAMKEVILRHGPYMIVAPGVALLHANPDEGVQRVALSLMTLQHPVNFGQSADCFVDLVFALAAVDHTQHLPALSQLAAIVDDPYKVQTLRNTHSKKAVLKLVDIAPN